jgi:hypothetical protein
MTDSKHLVSAEDENLMVATKESRNRVILKLPSLETEKLTDETETG